MHAILEYLPLIIFFVFYKFFDVYWATASLIVTSALQIFYYMIKKEPVPKRNWIFFALIVVFGGLTIFLQDDDFLKWKVTIINGIFAFVLFISDVVFKKNLLKQLIGENLTLPEKIWSRLNLSWAIFFAVCGVLNIYIASNYSLDTWVNFKVFGLTAMTFIFAIASVLTLYKYMPKDDEETALEPTNSNKK